MFSTWAAFRRRPEWARRCFLRILGRPHETTQWPPESTPAAKDPKRKARPHGRGPLPAYLPRRRIEHPIDPAKTTCPHCPEHPPLVKIACRVQEADLGMAGANNKMLRRMLAEGTPRWCSWPEWTHPGSSMRERLGKSQAMPS